MSVQRLRNDAGRNPRTTEEARALVKHVESLFLPWNVDALVDGFTDDCVVRFGTVPEFRGRDALRAFFTARSAKQQGYRRQKEFSAANRTLWFGPRMGLASPARRTGVGSWQLPTRVSSHNSY